MVGRITAWTNGLTSEATTFNYDLEDQLLETRRSLASGSEMYLNGEGFSYGYDPAGNRTFVGGVRPRWKSKDRL